MLRRCGFDVLHGPMMATVLLTDDGPLRAATDALIAGPPDFVVANTGIGMRTWLRAAAGWGLEGPLLGALGTAKIAARGPKVAGALRSAGLDVWWRAPTEQLADVREHLIRTGIAGRRVAVQRHGQDDPALEAGLRAAGADVVDVPVYRWEAPGEAERGVRLIEAVAHGTVDAVTFTSGPAVRNMMTLARSVDLADEVLAALNGPVLAACVGPVCAGVAAEEGLTDVAVPEHWRLGSLVRLVADELARRPG